MKKTFESYRKSTFGLNPSQNPAAHPGMGKAKGKGGIYTQNSKGKHPKAKVVKGNVTNEDQGKA